MPEHRLIVRTRGSGELIAATLGALADELKYSPDVSSVTLEVIVERQHPGPAAAERVLHDTTPTHLLAEPDDARTLCGLRAHGRDAVTPRMLARHVLMHIAGRRRAGHPALVLCVDCERAATESSAT